MKINDNQRIGAMNPYRKAGDAKAAYATEKKHRTKDQVEISSEAKELLDAQGSTRTEEQTRRIETLKASVASGTYFVDANRLAEKILPYLK
ncbi:flagellar biosynthesis anti-sigma factor FlgM [Paenibacillus alginolyticus]|uniref:Negative regulator of flagellin synthesis n=1 Tax=Paenibacillus alginolyticus TaxID=59839 RepID=A0ABT4GIT5_9BACL|nr:flagellar biosynthesis anti-sigma factor FlgM [Paenibacillus alginolyticus]MCY9696119.1 flagellar biosynthesis anti-sigma factor FlgM [Paenibacillus alginolyticus]MEC0143019.1 flagellar biosynthesis anti-sigma factor FlgM [Paenibacillus alginolyticus]